MSRKSSGSTGGRRTLPRPSASVRSPVTRIGSHSSAGATPEHTAYRVSPVTVPPRSGEEVRSPRFGQEGGELSYGAYLRVPELLELQTLLSDPPAHDELLFIVVHQAYELWFRQLLFELESVRDLMFAGKPDAAQRYLTRVHTIENVLVEQIAVLETMSPQDFLQ